MVVPTSPGRGMRLQCSSGVIEAYGGDNVFGGTAIITDGNFLVTIGKKVTAEGQERKYFKNSSAYLTPDGQLHMYKWDATSGWVEICNLGKVTEPSYGDYAVWGKSTGYAGSAIYGEFVGNGTGFKYGVQGVGADDFTQDGVGVGGYGSHYGGHFGGSVGAVLLDPSNNASAPTHSARKGTLWVTYSGTLYINVNGSTTWQKVGAQ